MKSITLSLLLVLATVAFVTVNACEGGEKKEKEHPPEGGDVPTDGDVPAGEDEIPDQVDNADDSEESAAPVVLYKREATPRKVSKRSPQGGGGNAGFGFGANAGGGAGGGADGGANGGGKAGFSFGMNAGAGGGAGGGH